MIFWLLACVTKNISGLIQTPDAQPLENATVQISTFETLSNSEGTFQIDDIQLKKGTYTIKITHDGYTFYQNDLYVKGSSLSIPSIVLHPLEVEIPYLPINYDEQIEDN